MRPILIILILLLPFGCVPHDDTREAPKVDWQEVQRSLEDADAVIESYELAYRDVDGARADRLKRVRELTGEAITAVKQRIEAGESNEGDAVAAVRKALDFAALVIREMPDPESRATASAIYATVRVSLRLAHARMSE